MNLASKSSFITIGFWAAFMLLFVSTTEAKIYKWVDDKGQVHYSDEPPEDQEAEELKLKVRKLPPTERLDPRSLPDQSKPGTTLITDAKADEQDPKSSQKRIKRKGRLVMYSTPECAYCKKARAYFKANKIKYREYNINENKQAHQQFKALGGQGVPLFSMGRRTLFGFSESNFDRFYYISD